MWRLYALTATQFAYDFHVSPLEVMQAVGIPPRHYPTLLKRLALVHQAAQENQKETK